MYQNIKYKFFFCKAACRNRSIGFHPQENTRLTPFPFIGLSECIPEPAWLHLLCPWKRYSLYRHPRAYGQGTLSNKWKVILYCIKHFLIYIYVYNLNYRVVFVSFVFISLYSFLGFLGTWLVMASFFIKSALLK